MNKYSYRSLTKGANTFSEPFARKLFREVCSQISKSEDDFINELRELSETEGPLTKSRLKELLFD
jgi:hypothetical protein